MDTIKALLVILMSSVLVNNYVLNKFLGICPFLGVSKKLDQAAGMGTAVTFVMLVATAVTWPIQTFVLDKLGLGYLQTIVFILVIATLVQFVEIILKKYIPALHKSLGVYLPLITTNCAVLGVTINNIKDLASCWLWCCLPAFAPDLTAQISRRASKDFLSRSPLRPSFP